MRKDVFEAKLNDYAKIGEELGDPKSTQEEKIRIEHALDWIIKHNAKDSDTTIDSQRRIFELQSAKREIMKRFLERLKNIDNPFIESKEPGQIAVEFRDGKYRREDGQEITLGQLVTDGDWDLRYHPDPASVPRRVRKRFYLEEAKRELMRHLDLQLIEHQSAKRQMDWMKKEGYQRMKQELGTTEKSGLAAEKMVANFLRKLSIDHAASFQVVEADAYEDMEQKVDFIIKYKPTMTYRGVGVEEDPKAVGIQFTINPQPDVKEKKARQVALARGRLRPEDQLQDIVLVVLPLSDVSDKVRSWRSSKQPGGPEETWSPETKIEVIKAVLRGIVPDEEVDRLCLLFKQKELESPEPVKPKSRGSLPGEAAPRTRNPRVAAMLLATRQQAESKPAAPRFIKRRAK